MKGTEKYIVLDIFSLKTPLFVHSMALWVDCSLCKTKTTRGVYFSVPTVNGLLVCEQEIQIPISSKLWGLLDDLD